MHFLYYIFYIKKENVLIFSYLMDMMMALVWILTLIKMAFNLMKCFVSFSTNIVSASIRWLLILLRLNTLPLILKWHMNQSNYNQKPFLLSYWWIKIDIILRIVWIIIAAWEQMESCLWPKSSFIDYWNRSFDFFASVNIYFSLLLEESQWSTR